MSLLTKIKQYLNSIIPTATVSEYFLLHPQKINQYLLDFETAIDTYNQFRKDQNFPNHEFYKNAIELDSVFGRDLPKYTETKISDSVFVELANDKYFSEVWQTRPIENLIINLLLLIYRTTILQNHKNILIDSNGYRLVQISSTIEEMVFALYLQNKKLSIFPALSIWLKDWQTESFDERLSSQVLK